MVQSYILTYFTNAGILWTSVIAHVLYHGIVSVGNSINVMSGRKWYHVYAWGLSAITTVLPQLTNSYGSSGAWYVVLQEYEFPRAYMPKHVPYSRSRRVHY